jgi:tripartite-type tricarboxylate transporter receptor subunit TctC
MNRWTFTTRAIAALLLGAGALAEPAAAQDPSKPIRIVVPFGAGSSTDIIARIIGTALQDSLGQTVIIENKPGADGAISGTEVKRAAPDGNTLLLATNSPLSVAPYLQQKTIPYNPVTDFTPIMHVGYYTFFLVTNPSVPVKTAQELVTYAKANPGKLNYATGNTTGIVASALFTTQAKIDMVRVPYKTEPPAITDLLGNQVQVMFSSYATVAGQLIDKKLNALAVMMPNRSPVMPDVPTMAEVGFPDFPVTPWAAIVGPAGMPAQVVERYHKALTTILAKPEMKAQIDKQAFAIKTSTPAELGEIIKAQVDVWARLSKAAGLEQQ